MAAGVFFLLGSKGVFMNKSDLDKARRLAYKSLKEWMVKYENADGKRSFVADHKLAMDFLLESDETWKASSLEKEAASVLEITLHIEASLETGSAFQIPTGENETLLKILYKELEERIAALEALLRQSAASRAGKARAAKDPRTQALNEIEKEYWLREVQFKRSGYQAVFTREMHAKYPIIEDVKSITTRITKLNKQKISIT